jgi:hypothetical protein
MRIAADVILVGRYPTSLAVNRPNAEIPMSPRGRDRYQAQTQRGMNTRATYLTVWEESATLNCPTYRP